MKNPYKELGKKNVYKNPWISLDEYAVIRPDGKEGVFGIINMKAGSTILPVDVDKNVFLVKEYKFAVGRPSIELVSGGLDANESPLSAAKRELKEEVGAESDNWTYLGVIDPFTSVINSPNHMFMAEGISVELNHVGHPDEPIERLVVAFDEALRMVMDGEITHGASCVTILKAAKIMNQRQ